MFWSVDSCCANRDGYATSGPAAQHLLSASVEVTHDMSVVKRKRKRKKTKTQHNKQQALQEVHPSISKLTWNVMLIPNPHAGFPHRTHQSVTLQTVSRTGKQTRADTCQPGGTNSQTNGDINLSTARIGASLFISRTYR